MQALLVVFSGYLAVGVVFGAMFVTVGAARIDLAAARSSGFVRLVFLPGAAVLWPVLVVKWIRSLRGVNG